MKIKIWFIVALMLVVALSVSNANARKAVLKVQNTRAVVSPENTRDVRAFLYFQLPEEVFNPNAIVDFALLSCRVQIQDAAAGQISIFPVTTEWSDQSIVSWNEPWESPGGDYAEAAYMQSNYTLKSEWGEKVIEIDVTEIVQSWAKGELANKGMILKLSKDALELSAARYACDPESMTLKILYSYEYR